MSFSHIREVAELDFSLEPYDWPFASERAADIAAHWAKRRGAQPALYDGRVLLSQRHAFRSRADGRLAIGGAFFQTAYSRFLSWRDFGSPGQTVCNCFSTAALQSSDGAFLIGEMNAHTANAGRIYFPAGTPDLEDVFEARVDLLASVRR
ncbi:MAG: NUDIX hydrolase, partial [Roseiarcus sp.]